MEARCGHENHKGARFCAECGAPCQRSRAAGHGSRRAAENYCRECGHAVAATAPHTLTPTRDPRSYTPKHLAEKILISRAALEGERKQVTVLFVDVKGSVELAERLDPEEWHRILDRFFAILSEGVHRFEGTINQYTGDGIMALFGAPIAWEDHAQRACHAALHLHEQLSGYAQQLRRQHGLDFSARMGLNSGSVVVGKIGDDLRMDYTAQGQTVGRAARMEQIAEAGKIYLAEQTAALVAGYFELEDLGRFNIKGTPAPVRVFALLGVGPARTRLDVSRARGFSRFVGRRHEMAILEDTLERAMAGEGQVIAVAAEPGMGKSRLCLEFCARCRTRGVAVHESHAIASGAMVPFLPIMELLRSCFGVTGEDTAAQARQKIAGTVLLIDEQLTSALPLVFEFLGITDPQQPVPRMDPDARQHRLLEVAERLIRIRSAQDPTVLLIEDLHWLDDGSDAFLAHLAAAVAGTRTVLLVNFRPEYRVDWMDAPHARLVSLSPLPAGAMQELLDDLLGQDASVQRLKPMIEERTGGNPFFAEEVVQSLVQSGSLEGTKGAYRSRSTRTTPNLPQTVEAVVAARIDRLPEREKLVLQRASVIEERFPAALLRCVVDLPDADCAAAIDGLIQAEFIYAIGGAPVTEYAFRHRLTRDVAYQSQLIDRRAQVHAAVARAIETLYPEKLTEHSALLAYHLEGAGQLREAAHWYRCAAERIARSNSPETLPYWRKVVALLERVPESDETAELAVRASTEILNLAWRLGISAAESAQIFSRGVAVALRNGSPRLLAMLSVPYAVYCAVIGDEEGRYRHGCEALNLAQEAGDVGLELTARAVVVTSLYCLGRLREALAITEPAVRNPPLDRLVGVEHFGFSPFTALTGLRGLLLATMGRLHEAERELELALDLGRDSGELELLGWLHGCAVDFARLTGDEDVAASHARHELAIAERTGVPVLLGDAYLHLGMAHIMSGEWDLAISVLRQAWDLAHTRGINLGERPLLLALMAEACLGRHEHHVARVTAQEALVLARDSRLTLFELRAQLVLARALLHPGAIGNPEEIDRAIQAAVTLIERTGAEGWTPAVDELRAERAHWCGNAEVGRSLNG